MNHFYNSYFPNHNRAFYINNLQKEVEKNLPGVEGVDFAERARSTPKGAGVGRSANLSHQPHIYSLHLLPWLSEASQKQTIDLSCQSFVYETCLVQGSTQVNLKEKTFF